MITSISPVVAKELLRAGIALGQMAKAKGLSVAVKQGRYQIQHVTYGSDGVSTVTPKSGWISREAALVALS